MRTEIKWLISFILGIFLLFGMGLGINAYIDYNCKLTMAKEGKSSDDILRICR